MDSFNIASIAITFKLLIHVSYIFYLGINHNVQIRMILRVL